MRVYAHGSGNRNFVPTLGFYVLATSHVDKEGNVVEDTDESDVNEDGECIKMFLSVEDDEDAWLDRIRDHLTGDPWNWSIDESVNPYNRSPNGGLSIYGSRCTNSRVMAGARPSGWGRATEVGMVNGGAMKLYIVLLQSWVTA